MKNNKPAFTLIELLVVIAIIGILATISVLALSNARAKSRDAKRAGDMKQVQTALELFFNDNNRYPTIEEWNTGKIYSTTTDATSTYMQVIPTAPTPADGNCGDKNNIGYSPTENGASYSISFCLGNTTGTLTPGPKCLTPGGIVDVDCGGVGGAIIPPVVVPIVLSCFEDSTGCSWQSVGATGFSAGVSAYPEIKVYNGTPYVVYVDDSLGRVVVKKFNGTSWVDVGGGVVSPGGSTVPSLFIDDSGTPYVAYGDYNSSAKTTVKKFDGSSWVTVGSALFSPDWAGDPDIFVENGTPYVAFNVSDKATVMKFDGSSWVAVGAASFSGYYSAFKSLFVYSGTPYIVYAEENNNYKATVKKFDGSSWVTVGAQSFSASSAYYTNIYIDDGVPYVVYADDSLGLKATVKKFDGSSWVTVGTAGFSGGYSQYVSLSFYNHTPFISYGDGSTGYANIMKYNGSAWDYIGSQNPFNGLLQSSSFVYNGIVYLVYVDNTPGSSRVNVMKFDH